MPYRFFFIPSSTLDLDELNEFLKNHQTISEHWETCMQDGVQYQVLRLEYEDLPRNSGSSFHNSYKSSNGYKPSRRWAKDKKGDNRDENGNYVLKYPDNITEEQKGIFDVLRQERADFTRELNLSGPFILFNNEQLGEMIAKNVSTVSEVRKLEGIGAGRMKYAPRMLVALLKARGEEIPRELLEQAASASALLKSEKEARGPEKGGRKSPGSQEESGKTGKSADEEKPAEEKKPEETPAVQGELFSEAGKK